MLRPPSSFIAVPCCETGDGMDVEIPRQEKRQRFLVRNSSPIVVSPNTASGLGEPMPFDNFGARLCSLCPCLQGGRGVGVGVENNAS